MLCSFSSEVPVPISEECLAIWLETSKDVLTVAGQRRSSTGFSTSLLIYYSRCYLVPGLPPPSSLALGAGLVQKTCDFQDNIQGSEIPVVRRHCIRSH